MNQPSSVKYKLAQTFDTILQETISCHSTLHQSHLLYSKSLYTNQAHPSSVILLFIKDGLVKVFDSFVCNKIRNQRWQLNLSI